MKHSRIILAIAVLVLASLACQTVMGGGGNGGDSAPNSDGSDSQPDVTQPTEAPSEPAGRGSDSSTDSEFPMADDAYNVTEMAGTTVYFTKMTQDELLAFYRDEYTSRGYEEREILTVIAEGTFSIVFDGDPSGKSVVIQSVDMGDGSRTISIRLEDV